MINVVVWCSINVVINYGGMPFLAETAAKGIIKKESEVSYLVDFSQYALEKEYVGNYSEVIVKKDRCIKDTK